MSSLDGLRDFELRTGGPSIAVSIFLGLKIPTRIHFKLYKMVTWTSEPARSSDMSVGGRKTA